MNELGTAKKIVDLIKAQGSVRLTAVIAKTGGKSPKYKLFTINVSKSDNKDVFNWEEPKSASMSKEDAIKAIKSSTCLNAKVVNGEIKGIEASLDRLNDKSLVILSVLKNAASKKAEMVRVVSAGGKSTRTYCLKYSELIEYCEKALQVGAEIPVQNAAFVGTSADKEAHIRFYFDGQVLEESYVPGAATKADKKKLAQKAADVRKSIAGNSANTADVVIADGVSEQEAEIIRKVYSSSKDAGQAMASGLFNEGQLSAYANACASNIDISDMVNKEFTPAQIEKLAYGKENGVNVKPICNPSVPVRTMEQYIHDEMVGMHSDVKILTPFYEMEVEEE